MRIFLVSDTHFGHENIIKYCNRPFKSAEEMDWEMVRRWNDVVRPDDHVWHLGDVYMGCERGYIDNLLGQLKGKKRLILGNHDRSKDQILAKHFEKIVLWRDFKGEGALLSHVPLHPDSIIKGRINVHGHIHDRHVLKPETYSIDPRYRCVCVEHTDYTPICLDTLFDR